MSTVESTFDLINRNRKRMLSGKLNGYPFPIESFQTEIPVIEQGFYCVVTGQTKASKSKFTNYVFVYAPLMFAYQHPEIMRVKILYWNLEQTPEEITLQFISNLLYTLSHHKYRISPIQLKSVDKYNLLPQEILDLLQTEEYKNILKFYDEHVEFCDERNNVGINIHIRSYARDHGKFDEMIENQFTDEVTGETKTIKEYKHYSPDDPDEYVIPIIDHVSLIEPTRTDDNNIMKAIARLSKDMVWIKRKLKYIPVVVQQQSATETGGIEARKTGNIRPTKAGLSDCKNPGNDCSILFGLTNPGYFDYKSYLGYDITKLSDYIRIMEVVLNRDGRSNGICPLYFDGATNYFAALPPPNDKLRLETIYDRIMSNTTIERNRRNRATMLMTLSKKKSKKKFNLNTIRDVKFRYHSWKDRQR